jgi:hypothetical protein
MQAKIKKAGNKKISVKEVQVYLVFDSGGLRHSKRRSTFHKRKELTTNARRSTKIILIDFLEPIPENFGYSLRGYSYRERWAHTR